MTCLTIVSSSISTDITGSDPCDCYFLSGPPKSSADPGTMEKAPLEPGTITSSLVGHDQDLRPDSTLFIGLNM